MGEKTRFYVPDGAQHHTIERRAGLFDTAAMPYLVEQGRLATEAVLPNIIALLERRPQLVRLECPSPLRDPRLRRGWLLRRSQQTRRHEVHKRPQLGRELAAGGPEHPELATQVAVLREHRAECATA